MKIPFMRKEKHKHDTRLKAVILFNTVREGIQAEQVLLNKGYAVRKVGPPPEYRKGCEVAVEIDISNENEIQIILDNAGIQHQGIVPL